MITIAVFYLKGMLLVMPLLPDCLLNKYTGLFCPLCGATRSLDSILCFDVYGSIRYNPLLYFILLLIIFSKYIKQFLRIYSIIFIFFVFVFTIARNLPFKILKFLSDPLN